MIAVLLSRESERDRCRLQEISFNQYCKIIPLFIFHSGSAASERKDRNLSKSGDILPVDSNTAGKKLRPQRVDSSTYFLFLIEMLMSKALLNLCCLSYIPVYGIVYLQRSV